MQGRLRLPLRRLLRNRSEGLLFQRHQPQEQEIAWQDGPSHDAWKRKSPPPELAQAEAFIQKQDYAAAEPLLRKVLAGDATNAASNYVAWFELGFVENGLGKVDESIAAYRKSVAAKPDVFESNLNLGLQLAKTHQPDAAQFLSAATQLKPTSHVAEGKARAWLSLAHVLEATKPEEAIAAYRQAAVLRPKDSEPHLSTGALLEKQNKFSDAEDEYKQALALDPSSSDAVTGLANIYMHGRRLPEAEAELRKLVDAHPAQADARIQLGRVLAAEGKNDNAIAEIEAAAKLAPADVSVQRDLADLYLMANKYDQAEAAYRALLTASPNDAELHQSLGKALLRAEEIRRCAKGISGGRETQAGSGRRVRRFGLRRQRKQGLCVDDQGVGYAREICAGRAHHVFSAGLGL